MARLVLPNTGWEETLKFIKPQTLWIEKLKKKLLCDNIDLFKGSGDRQVVFDVDAAKKSHWKNDLASEISTQGDVYGRAVILEKDERLT